MAETALNKDNIREPGLWQLYLGIDRCAVEVMAYCPLEDHSLITETIPLDPAASSVTRAIEEAVYARPVLLGDYKRVSIVVRTDCFTLLPDIVSDNGVIDEITAVYLPQTATGHVIVDNPLPGLGAVLRMGVQEELYNFLMRTFNCPRLYHNLTPLCLYFNGSNKSGNVRKTFVNLRHDSFDIMAFGHGTLSIANTFSFRDPMDAVYYILACREMLGMDTEDELLLCGNRGVRDTLTPILRQYLSFVMPVIFPSAMFKAGGQTAMNAPFDLIVLPLCE